MDTPQKEFEMKCFIDDIDRLCYAVHTVEENHFNIPWKLKIQQIDGCLSIYLVCLKENQSDHWEMKTEVTVQVLSKDGTSQAMKIYCRYENMDNPYREVFNRFGWFDFMTWDRLENDYAVDGKVTIQANVRILEMVGFEKENLKNFDESVKEFSDIVLIVGDRKFYTSKLFLGFQSSYFKSLLLGDFAESKQSEVVLKDINPDDFQNFLELIHAESPIDDNTIEGILHLSVLYDSPIAIKRCEEFLVEKSKKTLKVKLQMSARYNLKVLKEKCMSEIKSIDDIRSLVSDNIDEMDSSLTKELFKKCIVLTAFTSSAMDTSQKEFEIKFFIDDIDRLVEGIEHTVEENHFNIPWKLEIRRTDDFLSLHLACLRENHIDDWEVKTETTLEVLSKNGTSQTINEICRYGNEKNPDPEIYHCFGWSEFMKWDMLKDDLAVDGEVVIQAKSRIIEMVGFKKENLMNFDESMKEFSDIVMIVGERMFYTSKLFLGFQSSYFKSLLLGDFAESKQSEVVLKDINPDDFQNFLELIHAESPIDDNTIEGILQLAVLYDSPIAIKRCEEFLVKISEKTLKVKLELSTRYNLKVLKEKCISEINSIDDLRSVVSDELDPSISNALLQKFLHLC
ncbi:hypothetical protein CRE_11272 [Caenorhabditis remanei]|uniref:BTB domain-containing protein n=1 Tax=Caenorhabditis remanei TaxID=31234 RepID=E3MQB2_CAERE|nr:hypothetical protein CRE_11272 [Caenorhabditis remanei]